MSDPLSIVFDGAFAAIDAAVSGLALFVSRLVTRGEYSRRFQFGCWHIEPMALAFAVSIVCSGMYFYERRLNRRIGSDFERLDAQSWLMSALIGFALVVTFRPFWRY